MSLKKYLKTMEAMRSGSFAERTACKFMTGTCKVAGFLLEKSSRVRGPARGQVFIEYIMLLVVIALFSIVFTSGSFFTRFRNNMQGSMDFAMNTMEQQDLPTPPPSNGVTLPWWDEALETGGYTGGTGVAW